MRPATLNTRSKDMDTVHIVAAVARLKEVGTPLLRDIEGIRRMLNRAAELERNAQAVRQQADQMTACLLRKAQKNWTAAELAAVGLNSGQE